MTTKPTKTTMHPYCRQGEIDYASLDFNPDVSVEKPDAMEQHLEQWEVLGLLIARFTDFNQRPDVFVDFDSNICYDRSNLNVRISPDIYISSSGSIHGPFGHASSTCLGRLANHPTGRWKSLRKALGGRM